MTAARDQAMLPPVQLVRTGGDYWVVDGHNRVALARELGQLWIDADVTELDMGSKSAAAAAEMVN
jgi:ParB-like chromosome segregation protein Spo0J